MQQKKNFLKGIKQKFDIFFYYSIGQSSLIKFFAYARLPPSLRTLKITTFNIHDKVDDLNCFKSWVKIFSIMTRNFKLKVERKQQKILESTDILMPNNFCEISENE